MMTVIISFIAIILAIAGVVAYLHFSNSKSESEQTQKTDILDKKPLQTNSEIIITSDSLIENLENVQKEIPLKNTISGESISVQNNLTFDNNVTYLESQITDAVTQSPKPKKKRGRKPTKKVKK